MTGIEAAGPEDTHPDSVPEARARARKSPTAFRTISEVADDLHIPQHVLRFWETKFPQVRPLKRGGGRRYYRPEDIVLLRRISGLLYVQGYTIKGVQRLLREGGGQLADDIPPPAPEEKAEDPHAEVTDTVDETQLAMPGIAPPEPPPLRVAKPRPAERPEIEAIPARDEAAEAEIARLRALLQDALSELEALRALLP